MSRRRKICVFMNEITQTFQHVFGKALSEFALRDGMDVFFYTSYGSYSCPYGRNLLSEIGKKNIIHLPDFSVFDAVIVLPNTFDIFGMDNELYRRLRKEASCHIFCIQSGPSDFHTITIKNKQAIKDMTNHFILKHNFKKIFYMSGPFDTKETPERLEGYTEAMMEAGLKIGPNYIYEGNYWRNRGAKAMNFFLNGTEDYPEAIVCANDYMALSICDELTARGKRVPEDVAVSGFDGIQEGLEHSPSLTSVMVSPELYAAKLFDMLRESLRGNPIQKQVFIQGNLLFGGSCGCHEFLYSYDHAGAVKRLSSTEYLLREAGRITSDYQNDYDLDNAMYVANYYFHTLGCKRGYLCLCTDDESNLKRVEENKEFTDQMILKQIMYIDRDNNPDIKNIRFDRKDILPKEILEGNDISSYVIFPLHFKNMEYGYLVLEPGDKEWPNSLTSTYINTLSGAIENSIYEQKFRTLSEAKKLSQTDPLTGLNNRRGFEDALSKLLADDDGKSLITIVSIDMDGLKPINDIYGHQNGDLAITSMADILRATVKGNEISARFGGDEFMAVLVSDSDARKEEFKKQFFDMLKATSDKLNKPFKLGASIGMCDLKNGDTAQIITCMQIADQRMYEVKKEHHKLNPTGR